MVDEKNVNVPVVKGDYPKEDEGGMKNDKQA